MKGKAYKLNNSKRYTIGLAISVLAQAALVLPVPAQQKDQQKTSPQNQQKTAQPGEQKTSAPSAKETQKNSGKTAATSMAGPGKLVPADLDFNGHACKVLVPGDFSLSEFITPAGKLFCFKGPQHPDKKAAVFNVTIMPAAKGAELPGERDLMETMLKPQREGLKEYKEEKQPIFTNGGHSFKGVSFTGNAPDGEARRGFVYLTQDKETFFVIFAQDEKPFADHSLPLLLNTAHGCQIKNTAPEAKSGKQKAEVKSEKQKAAAKAPNPKPKN